ncbi:MAG: PP2C family protein-serine/threonine phosphatase [Phycisphaerales bacterium]
MAQRQQDQVDLSADRGVFRAEYERELGQWLRRRLGYLCIAYALFQTVSTTVLVLAAISFADRPREADLEPRDPTPIERRAEAAERRAEAGLPAVPGDRAALRAAKEIEDEERRRLERERGSEAIVSTLDAFGRLAQDWIEEVREPAPRRGRPALAPSMRPMDRWWNDGAPVRAARSTGSNLATPADAPRESDPSPDSPPESTPDAVAARDAAPIQWWAWMLSAVPVFGILAYFGLVVRPKLVTRSELLTAASRMILALGFVTFAFEAAVILANPELPVRPLFSIFLWHFTASLFLPWNWRESLKPIAPLLACWFMLRLGMAASDNAWGSFLLTMLGTPFLFLPALVVCEWRLRRHQRRFKSGFIGRRFLAMRREFQQARAVHESLFPKPTDLEWMRFDFGYRPAADIGGDFIHTWVDPYGRFHLALIDVTGHGLASAMSVARIHGEIERLRDEHPDEGPAKILSRLNRYFHRLLARHRLYATGILIMLDPRSGELRFASAGHPPMFLRSRSEVTELASTTFLLGAVDGDSFGEDEVTVRLHEGDTLVLFTDGAYDARNPRGERLGLDRLREILQKPAAPAQWTKYLMRLVETFEAGMPEDDLLIAEVTFLQRTSVSSVTGDDLPVPARRRAEATA